MLRRLPLVLGAIAALATLVAVGPVAVAVALLRSSPGAQGPDLAGRLLIALLVLGVAALAGLAACGLTRLLIRLLGAAARRFPLARRDGRGGE